MDVEIQKKRIETIAGDWLATSIVVSAMGNSINHMNVTIFVEDEGYIKGTFFLTNEYVGSIRYMDTGSFEGYYNNEHSGFDIVWNGDRDDRGSATMLQNEDTTLTWQTMVEKSDGLFTLPERIMLWKNKTDLLTEDDINILHTNIQKRYPFDIVLSDMVYVDDVVRVIVQPKDSVTEPIYEYFRNNKDNWEYIGGGIYGIEEKLAENLGISFVLLY